jgi:hypothetical protein
MNSSLPYLTAAVRWGLGLLAGWLVSKGLLTAEHSGEFVTMIAGIVIGAVPLAWSMFQKAKTTEHLQTAADAPKGSEPPKTPL